MYQCLGGFIILIRNLIAPHSIHCLASLQRKFADILSRESCLIFTRKVAFKHLEVLTFERSMMMIISHEAGRLKTVNQCVLLRQLPVKPRVFILIPPTVKPYCSYLAVIGKQLRQLIIHKLIIAFPVTLRIGATSSASGSSPDSIFTIPVDVRII